MGDCSGISWVDSSNSISKINTKNSKLEKKFVEIGAQLEVEKLIASGEKFIIDKDTLDLNKSNKCLYGQKFGNSNNTKTKDFMHRNKISKISALGFRDLSALEIVLYKFWKKDEKQKCYDILDLFCTYKNDGNKIESKLFKL